MISTSNDDLREILAADRWMQQDWAWVTLIPGMLADRCVIDHSEAFAICFAKTAPLIGGFDRMLDHFEIDVPDLHSADIMGPDPRATRSKGGRWVVRLIDYLRHDPATRNHMITLAAIYFHTFTFNMQRLIRSVATLDRVLPAESINTVISTCRMIAVTPSGGRIRAIRLPLYWGGGDPMIVARNLAPTIREAFDQAFNQVSMIYDRCKTQPVVTIPPAFLIPSVDLTEATRDSAERSQTTITDYRQRQ